MTTVREECVATTAAIVAAWESHTSSKFELPGDVQEPPRDHLWASGIRDCTRRMALDLLHPTIGRDFDLSAMERMLFGREREAALVARLMQIGPRCTPPFEIIESQSSFAIVDGGVKILTGKVDGRLYFGRDKPRPVFEVKAGRSVERIHALDDFEHSPWTRHMPDQMLLYLYAKSEPWGFFILDVPGSPRFIPVVLEDHLDRVTETLDRAHLAVDARHDRAPLPDFHGDPSVCRRCPHLGNTCAPPIDYAGVRVLEDPELELVLQEREAVRAAAKTFDRLDKRVKALLGREFDQLLVGDFVVTGKRQKKTTTEVPFTAIGLIAETLRGALPKLSAEEQETAGPVLEELAEQLRRQFKVTEPEGGFRVIIERVGTAPADSDEGGEE